MPISTLLILWHCTVTPSCVFTMILTTKTRTQYAGSLEFIRTTGPKHPGPPPSRRRLTPTLHYQVSLSTYLGIRPTKKKSTTSLASMVVKKWQVLATDGVLSHNFLDSGGWSIYFYWSHKHNTIYTSKPIAELIHKSFHLFVLGPQWQKYIVIGMWISNSLTVFI
jgi:hypothetical protein